MGRTCPVRSDGDALGGSNIVFGHDVVAVEDAASSSATDEVTQVV
jgi:hypothetical protein